MEEIAAISVVALDAEGIRANADVLADILISCVHGGASVSFMAPLERQKARDFWLGIADGVERGERLLLAAIDQKRVVGTVQVLLKQPDNPIRQMWRRCWSIRLRGGAGLERF